LNSQIISPDIHHAIEEGLNCILGHFPEKEPIWPRTISTKTTEGRQVLVYDKEEALARFKQANYLDCKICAYTFYVEWKGINRQAPNLIFIDEDELNFKSREALDKGLAKTLKNISEKFGIAVNPTILWSGHGYHIYLPVKAFILEQENEFNKFEQPSRRFIQFAEQYLSNKKSDPCHSFTMSFKNCMLRVPGSRMAKKPHPPLTAPKKHKGPVLTSTKQSMAYFTVKGIESEISILEHIWPVFALKELMDNAWDWLNDFYPIGKSPKEARKIGVSS
jgi:hypothetical protein